MFQSKKIAAIFDYISVFIPWKEEAESEERIMY